MATSLIDETNTFSTTTTMSTNIKDKLNELRQKCNKLKKHSEYSTNALNAAGFTYSNIDNALHCETCGLKIFRSDTNISLFTIHAQSNPSCRFIRSFQNTQNSENQSINQTNYHLNRIVSEEETAKINRSRTFSNWSDENLPFCTKLIKAGFYNCNVLDRVICLHCNLICEKWIPFSDDPVEVHRTLSPSCPFVMAVLTKTEQPSSPSTYIINASSPNNSNGHASALKNIESLGDGNIASTSPFHNAYSTLPTREISFATWLKEGVPDAESLSRAGFFYNELTKNVACFYCNGILNDWSVDDDPMKKHVQYFPNCAYARQFCDQEVYREIQETKTNANVNQITNQTQSLTIIPPKNRYDESILTRMVAARLDLPITQKLLNEKFAIGVVRRCWENQLRLIGDDFICDSDLRTACIILQRQIECIKGNKENIKVPSIELAKHHETMMNNMNSTQLSSPNYVASAPICEQQPLKPVPTKVDDTDAKNTESVSNPCALCLTEERKLACVPCGHLATCVPCGHSLKSCPLCRQPIKAYLRVYV